MGRPHVVVDETYKKIRNTRETAFEGKSECTDDNVSGYYASSIAEAIDKAVWILKKQNTKN